MKKQIRRSTPLSLDILFAFFIFQVGKVSDKTKAAMKKQIRRIHCVSPYNNSP